MFSELLNILKKNIAGNKCYSKNHDKWNQENSRWNEKTRERSSRPNKSLEFTEKILEKKVKKLNEKHVNLENQCNELYSNSLKSEYFHNKLVDLEDRSRRNNLRIDGIAEGSNESWEQCEEQL